MNVEQFEKLDAQLLAHASKVLSQKRGAYAGNADVLANIKELAREVHASEALVLEVLTRKALNAYFRTLNGQNLGGEDAIERFVDLINYVRLGWACKMQYTGGEQFPAPQQQSRPVLDRLARNPLLHHPQIGPPKNLEHTPYYKRPQVKDA